MSSRKLGMTTASGTRNPSQCFQNDILDSRNNCRLRWHMCKANTWGFYKSVLGSKVVYHIIRNYRLYFKSIYLHYLKTVLQKQNKKKTTVKRFRREIIDFKLAKRQILLAPFAKMANCLACCQILFRVTHL